jgi:glutaconyl-CoA/methylmalonyl-CoA decarboxylase subunit gamma
MRVVLRHENQQLVLDVHPDEAGYRVVVDGREHRVDASALSAGTLALTVDGHRYRVDLVRCGAERLLAVGGEVYRFSPDTGAGGGDVAATLASPEVTAPMPGKVLQVLVRTGDHVRAGDGLLILEAMKMENRLTAEADGHVEEIRVREGDLVEAGQVLAVLVYRAAER